MEKVKKKEKVRDIASLILITRSFMIIYCGVAVGTLSLHALSIESSQHLCYPYKSRTARYPFDASASFIFHVFMLLPRLLDFPKHVALSLASCKLE